MTDLHPSSVSSNGPNPQSSTQIIELIPCSFEICYCYIPLQGDVGARAHGCVWYTYGSGPIARYWLLMSSCFTLLVCYRTVAGRLPSLYHLFSIAAIFFFPGPLWRMDSAYSQLSTLRLQFMQVGRSPEHLQLRTDSSARAPTRRPK